MQLILGDCLDVMQDMEPNSVDAIVTDPPYGLSFMDKKWDYKIPGMPFWSEAVRVAKPGCHLLAFGGTRTFHRLACVIEDAGWEIRDTLMWVTGQGFPKSFDVGKAIERAAGKKRNNVIHTRVDTGFRFQSGGTSSEPPVTDAARQWNGWGTGLKPAYEPIILARKPLDGTVAQNVQKWGTGVINVDGCRVGTEIIETKQVVTGRSMHHNGGEKCKPNGIITQHKGRWPANLIHDGSEEVLELFPMQKSGARNGIRRARSSFGGGAFIEKARNTGKFTDASEGSAARFFYCAKASRAEREAGCEGMEEHQVDMTRLDPDAIGCNNPHSRGGRTRANRHPCLKPLALMRYLCRLITPPNGAILDPFMGSGTTGMAAKAEGFEFIGIEKEKEYCEIAEKRIARADYQMELEFCPSTGD